MTCRGPRNVRPPCTSTRQRITLWGEISPAQRLFGYFNDGERKHWDVPPDGQQFLLELNNLENAEGDVAPITLVVNWAAGLRR